MKVTAVAREREIGGGIVAIVLSCSYVFNLENERRVLLPQMAIFAAIACSTAD
jgi:hypothetical protein